MSKRSKPAPPSIVPATFWAAVGPPNRLGNRYIDYKSLGYTRSGVTRYLKGALGAWRARGWTVEKVQLLAGWGES